MFSVVQKEASGMKWVKQEYNDQIEFQFVMTFGCKVFSQKKLQHMFGRIPSSKYTSTVSNLKIHVFTL